MVTPEWPTQPKKIGKVYWVKVTENGAMVQLVTGDIFSLWDEIFEHPTARDRIMHSMWLSLLEHAAVNDLEVEIGYSTEESSKAVAVGLFSS